MDTFDNGLAYYLVSYECKALNEEILDYIETQNCSCNVIDSGDLKFKDDCSDFGVDKYTPYLYPNSEECMYNNINVDYKMYVLPDGHPDRNVNTPNPSNVNVYMMKYDSEGNITNTLLNSVADTVDYNVNLGVFDITTTGTLTKNSDYCVDYDWLQINTGNIYAIHEDGDYVYVGGDFTSVSIGGESYDYFLIFNKNTKTILPTMASIKTTIGINNGAVRCIITDDTHIYIGGEFSVGSYYGFIKVNKSDYNVNVSITNYIDSGSVFVVYTIQKYGNLLYVGGDFTTNGGISSDNFFIYDGNTFTGSGVGGYMPTTRPTYSGVAVYSIQVDSNYVYVGGDFTSVGNFWVFNNSTTTKDTPVDSRDFDDVVKSLCLDGTRLYVGLSGGSSSKFKVLSTTDLNNSIDLKLWDTPLDEPYPSIEYNINVIYKDDYRIYIGGDGVDPTEGFTIIDKYNPQDPYTSSYINFNSLNTGCNVYSIYSNGTKLYVGGFDEGGTGILSREVIYKTFTNFYVNMGGVEFFKILFTDKVYVDDDGLTSNYCGDDLCSGYFRYSLEKCQKNQWVNRITLTTERTSTAPLIEYFPLPLGEQGFPFNGFYEYDIYVEVEERGSVADSVVNTSIPQTLIVSGGGVETIVDKSPYLPSIPPLNNITGTEFMRSPGVYGYVKFVNTSLQGSGIIKLGNSEINNKMTVKVNLPNGAPTNAIKSGYVHLHYISSSDSDSGFQQL